MKTIAILSYISFLSLGAYAQNKPLFTIQNCHGSNWPLKVDSIKAQSFRSDKKLNINKTKPIYGDSILKAIASKYPKSLHVSDTTCSLYASDSTYTLIRQGYKQTITNPDNDNYGDVYYSQDILYKSFGLIETQNDYLILQEDQYRETDYLIYNPKTRKCIQSLAKPFFIKDYLFCAMSRDYLHIGTFELFDLKNNKKFCFTADSWDMLGYYIDENHIYLELQNNSTYSKKYLKISF